MRSPIAERLTAQALSGPPLKRPVDVAGRLLAVQGQDPRGARLAVRARTSGLSAADVDRALTEDRSLLITWLNRGTLHLVRSEDYPWLHALTTPPLLTSSATRLSQERVTPRAAERGVETIERSLVEEGPLTGGWAGEVLALVTEQGLGDLDDAWRITTANGPIPYSPPLEDAFLPGPARIAAEVLARP